MAQASSKKQGSKTEVVAPSSVEDMFSMDEASAAVAAPNTGSLQTPDLGAVEQGQTVVGMRSAFAGAVKVAKPRDIGEVRNALLREADMAGETMFYGWGSGKDAIEGPSQVLAHALMRNWGNCVVEFGPIQQLKDAWIFNAYFIDLETGMALSRPFRMSTRWTVHGRFDEARKMDIRFQIGASKATRNVILKALPKYLADQAIQRAKAGVRNRVTGAIDKYGQGVVVGKLIENLEPLGITEAMVKAKYGVADLKAMTVDHIVMLTADYKAVNLGEETRAEVFGDPNAGAEEVATDSPMDTFASAGEESKEAETKTAEAPTMTKLGVKAVTAELKDKGVALSALEESYGGPLIDFAGKPGQSGEDFLKAVLDTIDELSK